jgi:outer membrane protein assembly factor BamB
MRMPMTCILLTLLTASAPMAHATDATQAWPGFRGKGDSVSVARGLPVQWSERENIAFKVALPGYGQSSPVVWNGRVFVTAVDGSEREKGFVLALDAKSGKELWRHEFMPTQKAKWSGMISRAAPTPVVDATAIYAFFEAGDVIALSHDGKPLWSRSLVKDYGEFKNNHGLGSSPAQTDDAVVILVDHQGPSYLVALDKKTGQNRWKTDRPSRSSWTSPVVARHGKQQQVIVSSNGAAAGYDAGSGKLLWEIDGLSGNTLPSACVAGDLVLIGAGTSRKGDSGQKSARSNCCLRLIDKDGKPGCEVTWSAAKAVANYASPLAHRGYAYFVNGSGVAFCIDMATGKECYAERIDGTCWATPIGAGEHVYFFGRNGRTTVLKSGPTFEQVASNPLWDAEPEPATAGAQSPQVKGLGAEYLDPILYGVAAVDGAFFVRTGTTLYRIGRFR